MTESRLLLVTSDFPPQLGGIARYLDLLARYFSKRIRVVTSVPQQDQHLNVYPVEERVLLSKTGWPKWRATVRLLVKESATYDFVFVSHVLPFGTAAWIASYVTKKPYCVLTHGLDIRLAQQGRWKRFLTSQIFKHARVVVTNSQALSQEVAQTFGVPLPLVVYPCLPLVEPEESHQTHNHTFRFLTVGRLIERKGHLQVLLALSRLKQLCVIEDFVYDIVGDGPTKEACERMAQELHLPNVVFHGSVSDAKKNLLYQQADLFVMPVVSDPIDKEGFGIVYLEAAQFAVPSIASNISGVDEAVLDHQTGRLVEPGNLEALIETMKELILDDDQRKILGLQAQQRVKAEFSCEKQFSILEPYL